MSYTDFYCRDSGSNLNAGANADGSEPGTSAEFTYASGDWVQGTGVFTVAAGDPASDGVDVGDWASVYPDGSSVTPFVGRVTARDSTTITVSLTAKAGTAPTDGTGNRTLKIGGAWKGPNGSESFPFNFADNALRNSSDDLVRVNLKNDAQYDITAQITHSLPAVMFQGYSTTAGDGGRAVIDGGTTGASYVLLVISSATQVYIVDFEFQNNGSTGAADGVTGFSESLFRRCVVHDVRGDGFSGTNANFLNCEAYACNQSNTNDGGGFKLSGGNTEFCISHHNTGSNSSGFTDTATNATRFDNCIAHANGEYGFHIPFSRSESRFYQCDAYDNAGSGFYVNDNSNGSTIFFRNCNSIGNGGWGIELNGFTIGEMLLVVLHCGFGQGTQANASGTISGDHGQDAEGTVLYTANTTPWADPDDGDFTLTGSEAKGAGYGTFLQTQSGYGDPSATESTVDIGATQAAADSGGVAVPRGLHGIEHGIIA